MNIGGCGSPTLEPRSGLRAAIAEQEERDRFEHNSAVECVHSLFERFLEDVKRQAKDARADWSGFIVGLEDLESEIPELRP